MPLLHAISLRHFSRRSPAKMVFRASKMKKHQSACCLAIFYRRMDVCFRIFMLLCNMKQPAQNATQIFRTFPDNNFHAVHLLRQHRKMNTPAAISASARSQASKQDGSKPPISRPAPNIINTAPSTCPRQNIVHHAPVFSISAHAMFCA